MPLGICHTRCFDNQISRHYYPGDQDDLPLDHQLAKHFTFGEMPQQNPFKRGAIRPEPIDFGMVVNDPAIKASHEGKPEEKKSIPVVEEKKPLPLGAQRAVDAAARQRAEKEKAAEEVARKESTEEIAKKE